MAAQDPNRQLRDISDRLTAIERKLSDFEYALRDIKQLLQQLVSRR